MQKSLLPASWDVPEIFRTRLGSNVGRQRPMLSDGHLLLVLHAPPNPDDPSRVGRFFWRAPDGAWKSNALGDGIRALNKHLDEYEDRINELDQAAEDATTASQYFEILEQMAPLQRAAKNLHHVLQEARTQNPDFRDIIDVRDHAYAIERTADLLFDATQNAVEFMVARRAEEQAQASHRMAAASHRLNILAAFFFPVITLAAIFGVDLGTVGATFGFEPDSRALRAVVPIAFVVCLVGGLVVGGVLTRLVNRDPNSKSH